MIADGKLNVLPSPYVRVFVLALPGYAESDTIGKADGLRLQAPQSKPKSMIGSRYMRLYKSRISFFVNISRQFSPSALVSGLSMRRVISTMRSIEAESRDLQAP